MVESISDSDRDNETIPSLIAATPSPSITPTRKVVSPKRPASKSRPRKERISPQEDAPSPTSTNGVSHELFGDYMSIEELATQTEKAYEERKAAGSPKRYAGSPKRYSNQITGGYSVGSPKVSPRVSPRRLAKKKSDGSVNSAGSSSAKRSKDATGKNSNRGSYVLVILFLVTIVLPFLLCESFLLVLTWRYNGMDLKGNSASVGKMDATSGLSEVQEESCGSPSDNLSFANDDAATESSNQSESNAEHNDMDDKQDQAQAAAKDLTNNVPIHDQDTEGSSTIELEAFTLSSDELGTDSQPREVDASSQRTTKQKHHQQLNDENQKMLQEAFTLISTARSLSKWEMIEQITSAELLCRTVSFRAKEMGLMTNDDNKLSDGSETDHDEVTTLFFQSNLCIGGAKMSMSVKDVDGMIADAKQVFEHLSTIDPYNLEAQAGLGTSILAQGILYNANNSTNLSNDASVQTSLLTLATFHLKLASSLCSQQKPAGTKSVEELIASNDDLDMKRSTAVTDRTNYAAHAAILHNLALAYIALGDSNSSTPLLLRAAAIHRQLDASSEQDSVILWNLPNQVLQLVEEQAWLLAAKKSLLVGTKQKKKRRIPFVPEGFTLDEMEDYI